MPIPDEYAPASEVFETSRCHVCDTELPPATLDLGMQPMCDDLVPIGDARVAPSYPIRITLCSRCLTAHQQFNIRKERLFPADYHYRPRFTQDVLNGMRGLVSEYEGLYGPVRGKLVCDVGCNDGSLLSFFRDAGAQTCGIEPTGAAADASAAGHEVVRQFFTPAAARELVARVGRRPDVVTFTNVFAHIEDLNDALAALGELVAPGTVVVIENHYLGTVLRTKQFDTFYHEHPRTYSLRSFEFIAQRLGGRLANVAFPTRYGGNIRVVLDGFGGAPSALLAGADVGDADLPAVRAAEDTFPEQLAALQGFVDRWRADASTAIATLRAAGVRLEGKSFPGRAAILIALLGLTEADMARVYEKPDSLKVGTYLPGTRIPIVSDADWISGAAAPDAMVIWGWHIADEISRYLRENGYRGRLFTPLPQFAELA